MSLQIKAHEQKQTKPSFVGGINRWAIWCANDLALCVYVCVRAPLGMGRANIKMLHLTLGLNEVERYREKSTPGDIGE